MGQLLVLIIECSFLKGKTLIYWKISYGSSYYIAILEWKIPKYFYRIMILDKYYLKSYTSNDTSVCFQYLYSVFCFCTAKYTAKNFLKVKHSLFQTLTEVPN